MKLEELYQSYLKRYELEHSPEERLAFAMIAEHISEAMDLDIYRQQCIDLIIEETGTYKP